MSSARTRPSHPVHESCWACVDVGPFERVRLINDGILTINHNTQGERTMTTTEPLTEDQQECLEHLIEAGEFAVSTLMRDGKEAQYRTVYGELVALGLAVHEVDSGRLRDVWTVTEDGRAAIHAAA